MSTIFTSSVTFTSGTKRLTVDTHSSGALDLLFVFYVPYLAFVLLTSSFIVVILVLSVSFSISDINVSLKMCIAFANEVKTIYYRGVTDAVMIVQTL